MTAFPAFTPSSRTFTPGDYPASAFTGLGGKQNRVRHSTAMLASQLRLSFIGLSEANMLSILSHYQGQQGSYLSFDLPSSILSGLTASDFTLADYSWRYAGSPEVEDFGDKLHTVTLTLESVPPEGAALAGLASNVTVSLASGLATGAANVSGQTSAVTVTLQPGQAAADQIEATAFSLTVQSTMAPGSPTADASTAGLDLSIGASFSAGAASLYSVSLLLHMDGSNGSTTFTDNSSNAFTITANGNAQISTTQSKFGGSSAVFDGNGDFLSGPGNAAFVFGTGDFTIEAWVRLNSTAEDCAIVSYANSGDTFIRTSSMGWLLEYNKTTTGGPGFRLFVASGSSFYSEFNTGSVAINTWHHVAAVRSNGTVKVYLNGVGSAGSTINVAPNNAEGSSLSVGRFWATGASVLKYMNGFVDELRITKGAALYTSNFTPPTAAFPDP